MTSDIVGELADILVKRATAARVMVVTAESCTGGMVAAALGHLSPLQGALLQEAIDVAVILNAMRALGGTHDGHPLDAPTAAGLP